MNPHFNGSRHEDIGSGAGVLEFRDIYFLLDAIRIIARDGFLSQNEQNDLHIWFVEYLDWLENTYAGMGPRRLSTIQWLYFDLQTFAIAAFIQDTTIMTRYAERSIWRLRRKKGNGRVHEQACDDSYVALVGWSTLSRMTQNVRRNIWTVPARNVTQGDDDGTWQGDDNSTLQGDDNSTLQGDDNSALQGDDNSTLQGGDDDTLKGDDDGTLQLSLLCQAAYVVVSSFEGTEKCNGSIDARDNAERWWPLLHEIKFQCPLLRYEDKQWPIPWSQDDAPMPPNNPFEMPNHFRPHESIAPFWSLGLQHWNISFSSNPPDTAVSS